jgi:hypothetical protein
MAVGPMVVSLPASLVTTKARDGWLPWSLACGSIPTAGFSVWPLAAAHQTREQPDAWRTRRCTTSSLNGPAQQKWEHQDCGELLDDPVQAGAIWCPPIQLRAPNNANQTHGNEDSVQTARNIPPIWVLPPGIARRLATRMMKLQVQALDRSYPCRVQ